MNSGKDIDYIIEYLVSLGKELYMKLEEDQGWGFRSSETTTPVRIVYGYTLKIGGSKVVYTRSYIEVFQGETLMYTVHPVENTPLKLKNHIESMTKKQDHEMAEMLFTKLV